MPLGASASLTTAADTLSLAITPGECTCLFTIAGTFADAVLQFDISNDNGQKWVPAIGYRTSDAGEDLATTAALSAARGWWFDVSAASHFRVTVVSITSGTVVSTASTSSKPIRKFKLAASGAQSGKVYDPNGVLCSVLYAKANPASATTDGAVVAAVTGKKIRVLQVLTFCGATATDVTFTTKPSGAGTAISPLMAHTANQSQLMPFNVDGWFETGTAEGLSVTTGSGSAVGILVGYIAYTP